MGPDETHPQILRKLGDEVAKPVSTISEKLQQSSEVPTGGKRGHFKPSFKRNTKETTGLKL